MKPAFLLLFAACASASVAPHAALREVDETEVADCRPVGRFEGNSAQPGETGMTQARDEARAKAAGAGATTVVTDREWQTPDVASAAVKAYDCT